MDTFVAALESVIPQHIRLKKAILSLAVALFPEEIRLLTTIPGFSAFTAAALTSDVADIKRFASAKKLCAYLRTAPSIKSSNKTRHVGPVSKCGRSLTVSPLTQSVNHLKTASPSYADFSNRLRTGKSAGKCRIALIRKTLTTAYYMLRRGTELNHKNFLAYECKHRVLKGFIKDYRPAIGEKEEVETA